MRLRTLLAPMAIVLVLLGAAFAACGGGDDDSDGGTPTSASGTPGAETPGAVATTTGGGGAGGGTITLTIADGTATVGQTADVELQALGLGPPGLGAYTVDISFDKSVISATDCASPEDQGLTFCNVDCRRACGLDENEPGIVRSVGAIGEGVPGDVPLGTITFTCNAAGTSELTISVDTFADATIGNPTDINHAEENGTITCS